MKLIRLRLENFRQYRDQELRFSDGMTAIVGANGSGKSTLLEAITYALYGAQRKTGTGARTKREGLKFSEAGAKDRVRVTLEFDFDGRRYIVERGDRGATLTDVTEGRSLVQATSPTAVKAACERLLRLTYEQFTNSFCAEQKSLAFLQFATGGYKQEQVAKMLGYDRLRGAGKLGRDRAKEMRSRVAGLEEGLGSPEEMKRRIDEAKRDRDETARRVADGEKTVAEFEVRRAGVTERKGHADEYDRLSTALGVLTERSAQLKQARERATTAQGQAERDLGRRKALDPDATEFQALERRLAEFAMREKEEIARNKDIESRDRLSQQIGELEAAISKFALPNLNDARGAVSAALAAHTAAQSEIRAVEARRAKEIADANAALTLARNGKERTQTELAAAEELVAKGICPVCEQPTGKNLEDKLKGLQQARRQAETYFVEAEAQAARAQSKSVDVETAEAQLKASAEAHTAAQQIFDDATRLHREATGRQELLAEARKRRDELTVALEQTKSSYDPHAHAAAKQRAEALNPAFREWMKLEDAALRLEQAAKELTAAQQEFEAAHAHYKALQGERAALPFESADEAKAAVGEFNEFETARKVAAAQLEDAKRASADAKQRLEATEKLLAQFVEKTEQIAHLGKEATTHEMAAREMGALRDELNAKLIPELESRASDILAELTSGRYPQLRLDGDFNASVVDGDWTKDVISGGEEDVVALALRLALSELIQERQGRPMSLLILDEVFGSLDSDRRQSVLERLDGIKGRFAQIFVISHIEEINHVADHCISVRRDEATGESVVGDLPVHAPQAALL